VAKFKQFLIENLIRTSVGDRELAKNKEIGQGLGIWKVS
jgi:hypothetical protein